MAWRVASVCRMRCGRGTPLCEVDASDAPLYLIALLSSHFRRSWTTWPGSTSLPSMERKPLAPKLHH